MPTILDLLGLTPPLEAQGTSLAPTFVDARAVREVAADPWERINLIDRFPRTAGELRKRLSVAASQNWELTAKLRAEGARITLTAEEVEELRGLGYL